MQNAQTQNAAPATRLPRTERQREASRRNGARSLGPITPAGICRSSANSRRHGLYAKAALGPSPGNLGPACDELLAEFRLMLEAEFSHWGSVAQLLIEIAARAQLGTHYVRALETQILNEEIARQRILYPEESPAVLLGIGFRRLADETGTLHAILRSEAQFDRQYERAISRLQRLLPRKQKFAERTQRRNRPPTKTKFVERTRQPQPSAARLKIAKRTRRGYEIVSSRYNLTVCLTVA